MNGRGIKIAAAAAKKKELTRKGWIAFLLFTVTNAIRVSLRTILAMLLTASMVQQTFGLSVPDPVIMTVPVMARIGSLIAMLFVVEIAAAVLERMLNQIDGELKANS